MRTATSLAFFLSGLAAFGQMNTGEISGSVQDPTDSALPEATIIAEQAETGQKFTAVSNSSGEYLFAHLPVGVYSLTVSATNFMQSAVPRLEIHAGNRLRQDFTLQVGDSTGVVTVAADAKACNWNSAEIRDVIGRQQVIDLPLKGRQFLDLGDVEPGRGPAPRRHARRRDAAGRQSGQCPGAAQRTQSVSDGWRRHHR